ncbi:MAG: dipeptidase [Chloroflexota bacterium]|nr:dipeptidase [Chloroflexota bacterium]
MSEAVDAIETYLARSADERLEQYRAFLRIPSISALSQHAPDVAEAARFLAEAMSASGLENVEVSATEGHPVVYGDWLHAESAPTVLVYGHYDVQPVDPLDLWVRPPFEPRVEGGCIYARGAADDKGQVHLHLWAARAWLETQGRLPVNVRYVFEGEEESGSVNFDRWLEGNRQRLAADLAVISDSGFFQDNHPAITIGLRGLVYAQIDVSGPSQDLHSGTYGGLVQNPANALAAILAGLRQPDGRVAVAGFYDEVRELSQQERSEFARLVFDDARLAADIGVPELFGEPGFGSLERRGARPTLDVNGLWGGFQGEGSKTIIPAHAHAKVSCRLVPDMDPKRTFQLLRDHVLASAPPGVEVDVWLINDGLWSLTGIDHPATEAAATALEAVFGEPPVYLREGGSIPAAASFGAMLQLPVVLLGFTPPDDHAHSPNEFMRLDNYEGGIRTIVRYWEALGSGLD